MKETNVLFLDDEVNILNSFKRIFREESYGIFITSDHKEALDIISKEKIKVVVSDHKMPGISGIDFLKEVKDEFPDILRILLTGYLDIKIAEDAINTSAVYRFLNKPWNDEELKNAISQGISMYDLINERNILDEKLKKQNEELLISNEKLQNMYEAQKAFTSTVSHELRTPLASIKTAIDIVISESSGELNDDQKKFLGKAKNNVDRLGRLINDILDLTKMESGKVELNKKNNNLNLVINDVIDIQSAVAENKNIYLKNELDDSIETIYFDSDKINQVLNNLIGNAIKFTNEGGVTVLTSNNREKNNVLVSVKDTGPGIREEDMDKLFKKFQQLGDSSQQVGGTGLGLAICKEIITRHNGKIWVESEFGKGSSFNFILPIEERRNG